MEKYFWRILFLILVKRCALQRTPSKTVLNVLIQLLKRTMFCAKLDDRLVMADDWILRDIKEPEAIIHNQIFFRCEHLCRGTDKALRFASFHVDVSIPAFDQHSQVQTVENSQNPVTNQNQYFLVLKNIFFTTKK